MLNLDTGDENWPPETKPLGDESWEREPFAEWWHRNEPLLKNLHPQVAEQWVYRHWEYTPYRCIPLHKLTWEETSWPTCRILDDVASNLEFDSSFDFETFTGQDTNTGRPFILCGTWDYPIVILATPAGFSNWGGRFPDAKHLLIEGHQRMRLLNAYYRLGKPMAQTHKLFVLALSDG